MSRMMKCARIVARMGEMRNIDIERKRPVGGPGRRCDNNIRMVLAEIR